MAPVPCPFCDTDLEAGRVDISTFGPIAPLRLRFKHKGAGWLEGRKVLGAWSSRPAGLCPRCEALVIAPLRPPDRDAS